MKSSIIAKESCRYNTKLHIIIPSLAKKIGQKHAIFIIQLQYWLERCPKEKRGTPWIYNTLEKWSSQFDYWSLSTIRRVISSLEKMGIVISKKMNRYMGSHTKWYSLDYQKLQDILGYDIRYQSSKLSAFSRPKMNKSFVQNEQIYNTKNNLTNISSDTRTRLTKPHIDQRKEDLKNNPEKQFFKYKHVQDCQNYTVTKQLIDTSQEEQDVAKQMVDAWNEEFKYSLKPIKAYNTKTSIGRLYNILHTYFGGNIEEWSKYALKVNSSKFLMGEKKTNNNFKAVFSWLIKEETIVKILAGEYGVGDRELDKNNVSSNIEKQKENIVSLANTKISDYVQNQVNAAKEKEEFQEYVVNRKYEEDGDPYEMKQIFKNCYLSPQTLFISNDYRKIRQHLYELYIVKKHIGATSIEISKKLRKLLDTTIPVGASRIRILKSLYDKIEYSNVKMDIHSNGHNFIQTLGNIDILSVMDYGHG